ncbi:uncharacterized protein LOC115928278 [Strongylocentrotus purpuratus]|uniref:Ig-like domain-containing protein n=1 Tax=Strongylocentrotus purpuratus TaxID=7668 RepID=A0A7M7PGQ7_STRPU|nr:uncharacterized protein LOC115928278 [Strongylocentrotus purpuratus]
MEVVGTGIPGALVLLLIYTARLTPCQGVPTIARGPENQTANFGETVRLTCMVRDKSGGYLVAWFKDGTRITRNNNESFDSRHVDTSRYILTGNWDQGDYSLEIQHIISLDKGAYKCIIQEAISRDFIDTSIEATVSIEYSPSLSSFLCYIPESSDLRIGYTITFVCQADLGNPPASLSATYDLSPVNETTDKVGNDIRLNYEKTLEKEDNGKVFRCTLSQELLDQPEYCKVGPLVVEYKPMDIAITSAELPYDGSSLAVVEVNTKEVVFTCATSANPEAQYTWTVTEAQGCSKGMNHYSLEDQLILTKVDMAYDGAVISCTANNTIGKASTSITINVMNDDPNALCYSTTAPEPEGTEPTPTKAPVTGPMMLTTMHIIIIIIAAAFLVVIIILGYIAFSRRRETPIQLTMMSGPDDTRSIAESIIFHSRHNTPDPEHRGNSLGRMQSNFSTMSYDTQSIDSATALMHLRSLESPEYKTNPKLTGSPTRKLGGKCGKEYGKECGKEIQMDDMERSPFHRFHSTDNTYEGSPKRGSPTPPGEKSTLTRQPSEHKYEECPPLKKYTTHASQTDLAFTDDKIEEERQEISDTSDSDSEFDYNPKKQNFSVNNSNIRFAKHTEV